MRAAIIFSCCLQLIIGHLQLYSTLILNINYFVYVKSRKILIVNLPLNPKQILTVSDYISLKLTLLRIEGYQLHVQQLWWHLHCICCYGAVKKNTNKNVMYSLYMNVSTGNLNFWIEMLLPASACYVYYRIKETWHF